MEPMRWVAILMVASACGDPDPQTPVDGATDGAPIDGGGMPSTLNASIEMTWISNGSLSLPTS
jgi:hypothetical protein